MCPRPLDDSGEYSAILAYYQLSGNLIFVLLILFVYNFRVKDPLISVVIPSFDEMANLQKGVLDKVVHFFEKKKYPYEIIVVDDGSRDGSEEFVEKFTKENKRVFLIKNNHTGKAGAVTAGMLKAKGEFVLFSDMDQATPIEEVDKLLPYFKKGFDIVIGSRNTKRRGAPLSRRVISWSSRFLRKLIVGLPDIEDTQCGFKMFRGTVAEEIFSKIYSMHHGFEEISDSAVTAGFDVELLLIGKRLGYSVKEVHVDWLYVETRRVNPIWDSIEGVRELLIIRLNQMKHTY